MKKILLSIFVILSFGIYTSWNNYNNPSYRPLDSIITSSNDKISYELAIDSSLKALNKINSIKIESNDLNKKSDIYSVKTYRSTTKTTKKSKRTHRTKMNYNNNMMMIGKYKNGSYKGKISDAYYGNVQVETIITNGKLSHIKILDYPHNAKNSLYINSYALPILIKEAIHSQSAEINMVSGASATSPAFKESLASALIKAKA